ncbi:hypothetical protein ACLH0E_01620 [Aeromonas media]
MSFLNSITAGSSQAAQAVREQFHVVEEIDPNMLSITTLVDIEPG